VRSLEGQLSQPCMPLIEVNAVLPNHREVGGHENDAGSSVTFFTFLNLDNKGVILSMIT
jgi:hypothetical protein